MVTSTKVPIDLAGGLASVSSYQQLMEFWKLPIYTGYYLADLRTIELGWWEERKCHAAFLQLSGQQGVCESRVTEIAPGESLPPLKFALDEAVYVLQGQGVTTVSGGTGSAKKTFEWQTRSMFLLPANTTHQISNVSGTTPARLLHYNFLPMAMAAIPDPDFFYNNPMLDPNGSVLGDDRFSQAKAVPGPRGRSAWVGNFFPDMAAWDRLDPLRERGAGGRSVSVEFPNSPHHCHMSVFPSRTYKRAHRHGPGFVIVIPGGDGFSVMWEEGQENNKIYVPWHEASCFVPPNRWFHQHFNVGPTHGRYLAFHPPIAFSGFERVERAADEIPYTNEDPAIRARFAEELAKRGLTSAMPAEAYTNPDYEWKYQEEGGAN